MSKIIADKYITAVIDSFSKDGINSVLNNLEIISKAFENIKFSEMIDSPIIDNKSKEALVLSLVNSDEKFENFIKVLSKNSRLSLIPEIFRGIRSVILANKNEHNGIIYSKENVSDEQIKNLEGLLSKRFNSKISLDFQESDYNGVKIDLESLGLEISFSLDRLKQGISEYILKAI